MKLVPSQYDKIRKYFINHIQDISSLKVYSEDDEKNLKLLKDKLSEKFKKFKLSKKYIHNENWRIKKSTLCFK